MMNIIEDVPGVKHYAALGGLNVVSFASKSNSGTIFLQLKPWDERKDKSMQLRGIMAELQKRFAVIKEASIVVIPPPAIPGLGSTAGFSFMLEQKQSNDDIRAFGKVVQNFTMEANKRPEIARCFTFFTAKTPSYQLEVDREQCRKMGVYVSDVFNTIQTLYGKQVCKRFYNLWKDI